MMMLMTTIAVSNLNLKRVHITHSPSNLGDAGTNAAAVGDAHEWAVWEGSSQISVLGDILDDGIADKVGLQGEKQRKSLTQPMSSKIVIDLSTEVISNYGMNGFVGRGPFKHINPPHLTRLVSPLRTFSRSPSRRTLVLPAPRINETPSENVKRVIQ
jgi:hypothetical protein